MKFNLSAPCARYRTKTVDRQAFFNKKLLFDVFFLVPRWIRRCKSLSPMEMLVLAEIWKIGYVAYRPNGKKYVLVNNRTLMAKLNVSEATIHRAIAKAEKKGFLRRVMKNGNIRHIEINRKNFRLTGYNVSQRWRGSVLITEMVICEKNPKKHKETMKRPEFDGETLEQAGKIFRDKRRDTPHYYIGEKRDISQSSRLSMELFPPGEPWWRTPKRGVLKKYHWNPHQQIRLTDHDSQAFQSIYGRTSRQMIGILDDVESLCRKRRLIQGTDITGLIHYSCKALDMSGKELAIAGAAKKRLLKAQKEKEKKERLIKQQENFKKHDARWITVESEQKTEMKTFKSLQEMYGEEKKETCFSAGSMFANILQGMSFV